MTDSGTDEDLVTKYVESPTTGYAQFLAEIQAEGAATAGKVAVTINAKTLIGGFTRFYGSEAEQRACARYRSVWDASQVGGARAVDPSREPVDGGWLNPEAVFETGADARKLYGRIKEELGRMDLAKLHFVVVSEWGPSPFAKHFYRLRQPNASAVSKAKVEVRSIAARLARFLDLVTQGGPTGTRVEGETPAEFTGQVSTRRAA